MDELSRHIGQLPAELNPYLALDLDLARTSARALEEVAVEDMGPLHGMPMSIKDIVPTRDLPTTWGMAAPNPSAQAGVDGSFVSAARRAGAIIYAKTNTPPNAYADVTDNLLVGPTANPHDLARTPGGSSGGAGAVVAAGVEAITHGTDAGGSVRMPAAHCGVVGFKPSYGALPRVPAVDLWSARGHHGLLGRSVDDVRYGMDALVSADHRDPLSLCRADWDDSGTRPRRGRIAVSASLFGQDVDAAVRRVFDTAVSRLSDAGLPVVDVDVRWPDPVDGAAAQMAALEHHVYGALVRDHPGLFDDGYADYVRHGATVTMDQYLTAQRARTALYTAAAQFMDGFDAFVTPTLPVTSWLLTEDRPAINGTRVSRGPGSRWPDVLLANLLGWPAISIPAGWSGGLPVGLQVIAPWRSDLACLELATRVETILHIPHQNPERAGASDPATADSEKGCHD
ncbi:amidase [Tsukamurella soli]|uniref:amidase n=1 Tax=Tsukamurella soli TaxID=644556 RepID=UPI0031EB5E0A